MGSNLAGVWVLWNRTKALFIMGLNLAGVRVLWSRTKALFFMCSKSHVRHSFGVFFAWHGLDSCWRSVVSEPKLCFFFSNLTLTRLWAAIVRNPRRSGVPEPDQSFVFQFFFIFLADYRFQRWREAFCQRVFCLAWARILLAFAVRLQRCAKDICIYNRKLFQITAFVSMKRSRMLRT